MATKATIQALIDGIATGAPNTALQIRDLTSAILGQMFIGETKFLKVDSTFITANFDSTGLGTSTEMDGWAICNGNNGTTNDDGLVTISCGTSYPTLGATGGSKDAVVVSHEHFIASTSGSAGATLTASNYVKQTNDWGDTSPNYQLAGQTATPTVGKSSNSGVSGTDKNMQPYVVELKIQRIA